MYRLKGPSAQTRNSLDLSICKSASYMHALEPKYSMQYLGTWSFSAWLYMGKGVG